MHAFTLLPGGAVAAALRTSWCISSRIAVALPTAGSDNLSSRCDGNSDTSDTLLCMIRGMRSPAHREDGERHTDGARGGNPGADLLWELVGFTLAGIAAALVLAGDLR